ncbi:hypothetical protein MMC25_003013 [Agyrium rufum]|nr:hypothetical protein [Agyrium rufum]
MDPSLHRSQNLLWKAASIIKASEAKEGDPTRVSNRNAGQHAAKAAISTAQSASTAAAPVTPTRLNGYATSSWGTPFSTRSQTGNTPGTASTTATSASLIDLTTDRPVNPPLPSTPTRRTTGSLRLPKAPVKKRRNDDDLAYKPSSSAAPRDPNSGEPSTKRVLPKRKTTGHRQE